MEEIALNIIPTEILPICHVSQNDKSRHIRINLVDGVTPYKISSYDSITFNLRKPNNVVMKNDLEITPGESYVDIEVSSDMCDINGKNLCDLRISNPVSRSIINTSNFYMFVEVDPLHNPAPSPSGSGGLISTELNIISTTYIVMEV